MSDNLPQVLSEAPLGLDPSVFSNLTSYEECLDFATQLQLGSAAWSWAHADFYNYVSDKFGNSTIQGLSKSLQIPEATIGSYIRTAKAFPQDKRVINVTFSHHFQAAQADEFDKVTKTYKGSDRFNWIEKAADESWSTRHLYHEIQRTKKLKELNVTVLPCVFCKKNTGEIATYAVYSTGGKRDPERIELHRECWFKVLDFVHHGNEN